MLIYSTRFRVNPEFDKKEFVNKIIEWNRNGRYPVDDIEKNTFSFIAGDDDCCLEVIDQEKNNVIAARMHIKNDGGVWNTDIILNYGINILTAYVNKTVDENTVNTDSRAFIPEIIKQVIRHGYAGKSMGLDISEKALNISDRELLENAVASYDKYSLPMIYLSSASEISADKLAAKLAGLAVVVNDADNVLKERYPEPIYVFYPHANVPPTAFGSYPFHREIQRVVFDYLNKREYNKLETWDGIQNERSSQANLELLNKYRSAAADNEAFQELYSELEEKLNELNKQWEDISRENSRLNSENARLARENERFRECGVPLIMRGSENDLYPDEQREIVMDILREQMRVSLGEGTRRADIVGSIINANPTQGTPEKNKQIIKRALDGYKAFETASILKALKETGIEIIEHTGHYKIALEGDHRYVCEAAATCSDNRGGKNLIAEINKKMF